VDFVRKSVRAIGQCAIKIDEASERCINVLLDLINTKVNYVVQEAIIVIKVYVDSLQFVIIIIIYEQQLFSFLYI
jgi:vesicle coat complex subunit